MFLDVVLVGLTVVLAWLVFWTRRHVGALIMSVFAGALLASLSAQQASTWLASHGVTVVGISLHALVSVACILLPPILIWYGSPKQRHMPGRILGAIVFGIVTPAVVAPFASDIFDAQVVANARIDDYLIQYRTVLMAGALLYAIFDLAISHHNAAKAEKAVHKK